MNPDTATKAVGQSVPRSRDLLYESTGRIVASATPPEGVREPFPIVLQRRAREVVQVHARRSIVRISTLLAADALVVLLGRLVFRGILDGYWLGAAGSEVAKALIPEGAYSFLQLSAALLLGLTVFGNYRAGDFRKRISALFGGTALGLSLVFWTGLWGPASLLKLLGLGLSILFVGTGLALERLLVDRFVGRMRPASLNLARTIVVGPGDEARLLVQSELLQNSAGFLMLGFVDVAAPALRGALGSRGDLAWILEEHRVDTVILAGKMNEAVFDGLVDMADAAGCQLIAVPPGASHRQLHLDIRWRSGTPLLLLSRPALRGPQLVLKRIVDVTTAATVLILTSPLFPLVALAVWLSSPGPIFFKQVRVGKSGRQFRIYKFRTMVRDAEEQKSAIVEQSIYADGRLFKVPQDPRTTLIGRLLRRASLDELPQLWNVLVGDMSLVGPRPPLPCEVELYEEHHYTRFDMKPGITGPWQVSGRNKITEFEEVVRLESAYLRQWTIWKDFEILLRTVPAVLRMNGAH